MKNILLFLQKYSYWLLFFALETTVVVLYFSTGNFRRNVFITSANVITAPLYSVSGYLSSFFFSRNENERLFRQIEQLENENRQLHEQLSRQGDTFFSALPVATSETAQIKYRSVPAYVINNSVSKPQNYLTLNKGSVDGILPDMGVLSAAGIVGVVSAVSEHYSTVISVLNTKMNVSCKLKGGDFFGSLSWEDITNPRTAYLNDLPRHAVFDKGDTVITSGFSTIFPKGLMVGVVNNSAKQRDDNFYKLEIKLATDFYSLYQVRVLAPENAEERNELEKRNTQTK